MVLIGHHKKSRRTCVTVVLEELNMKTLFARFAKDESGATAIEYGLIAAIIGVGLVAALTGLKNNLSGKFNEVGTKLNS